jgi:transposase
MSTRGRPTLYKAENAELARKFCMLGATNEDLAKCFEVSRSTIDHWIDTIAEFALISTTTAEDAAARRGVGRAIRRSPTLG